MTDTTDTPVFSSIDDARRDLASALDDVASAGDELHLAGDAYDSARCTAMATVETLLKLAPEKLRDDIESALSMVFARFELDRLINNDDVRSMLGEVDQVLDEKTASDAL